MNVRRRSLVPLLLLLTAASGHAGVRVTEGASPALDAFTPRPASHLEFAFGPAFQSLRAVDAAQALWCGSAAYEFARSPGFGWMVRGELEASATESREALGMPGVVLSTAPAFVLHRDEASFAGLAVGARSSLRRGAGVDYLEATLGIGRWRKESSSAGPDPHFDHSKARDATQGTAGLVAGHRQPVGPLPFAGLIELGIVGRCGRDPGVAFPIRAGVALEHGR